MANRLTTNLKLRVSDNLTADAIYNLERIDLLGNVFPLGSTADLTIQSSGNIILNPSGNITLNSNVAVSGTLSLSSGQYTTTLTTQSQTENLTLRFPSDKGTADKFLRTDGEGNLSWSDPPNTNFAGLNDTQFTSLSAGQVVQYDGSKWVNVSLGNRQTTTEIWTPINGATKTITHNFNTDKIQVWLYDTADQRQVFIEGIDYLDNDTILLTAHRPPAANYIVHLVQTV